jgi:D-alanyl-D-alanine endopeptidase (penicillin-binding protein 7)
MPIFFLSALLLSSLLAPIQHTLEKKVADTASINAPTIQVSTAKAEEQPIPGIQAEGVYVADAKTNAAVVTFHEDTTWSIASLTKVMTAMVYLDQNPDLTKVITLESEDMVGGAQLKIPVGTKMTAIDLIHASLMSSANNATHALVRGTNLSQEEFVTAMNKKAQDLGLQNTTFTEPTGLDPANRSTPQEYSILFSKALEYSLIHEVMTTTQYTITPLNYGSFPIGSTNKLLKEENDYQVMGGKTGFTDGSDYNFVTQVKKGDKELTVVVFGDTTYQQAFKSAKKLADQTISAADAEPVEIK